MCAIYFIYLIVLPYIYCTLTYINRYETLNYATNRKKRDLTSDHPHISFDAFNKSFNIILSYNNYEMSPNLIITSEYSHKNETQYISDNIFVSGYVLGYLNSHAEGNLLDGVFAGVIKLSIPNQIDLELYYVERVGPFYPNKHHSIIYKSEDINDLHLISSLPSKYKNFKFYKTKSSSTTKNTKITKNNTHLSIDSSLKHNSYNHRDNLYDVSKAQEAPHEYSWCGLSNERIRDWMMSHYAQISSSPQSDTNIKQNQLQFSKYDASPKCVIRQQKSFSKYFSFTQTLNNKNDSKDNLNCNPLNIEARDSLLVKTDESPKNIFNINDNITNDIFDNDHQNSKVKKSKSKFLPKRLKRRSIDTLNFFNRDQSNGIHKRDATFFNVNDDNWFNTKEGTQITIPNANTNMNDGENLNKTKSYIPIRNTCSLFIQTDTFLWKHVAKKHGTKEKRKIREEIIGMISSHIKAVNHIYGSTEFGNIKGIQFVVQRIKILEDTYCDTIIDKRHESYCNPNLDVSNVLNLWSLENHDDFCLAYLWTYRDFVGGTLGLAWVAAPDRESGGLCETFKPYSDAILPSNTNINTITNKNNVRNGFKTFNFGGEKNSSPMEEDSKKHYSEHDGEDMKQFLHEQPLSKRTNRDVEKDPIRTREFYNVKNRQSSAKYIINRDGTSAGMNLRQTTFKSLNTGIITSLNYATEVSPAVSHLTLAHEIGHNLGSPHDYPPMCRPGQAFGARLGNYIMFSSATSGDKPNNDKFSECSKRNISRILDAIINERYGKTNCLIKNDGAFCGNGLKEDGEECDCGYMEECQANGEIACCYPRTEDSTKSCKRKPDVTCSPSEGPCCTKQCKHVTSGSLCATETECSHRSYCDGRGAQCPSPRHKPNRTTACNGNTQVCWNGQCTGSICEKFNLERCFITAGRDDKHIDRGKLCQLACQLVNQPETCRSSHEYPALRAINNGQGMNLKPGSPCNNYQGYCDILLKCREVDPEGPLTRLKNLVFNDKTIALFQSWITQRWWILALILLVLMLVMGLFIQCCAVHTPSSNPKKPPARSFSDTVSRTAHTLRQTSQHMLHPGDTLRRLSFYNHHYPNNNAVLSTMGAYDINHQQRRRYEASRDRSRDARRRKGSRDAIRKNQSSSSSAGGGHRNSNGNNGKKVTSKTNGTQQTTLSNVGNNYQVWEQENMSQPNFEASQGYPMRLTYKQHKRQIKLLQQQQQYRQQMERKSKSTNGRKKYKNESSSSTFANTSDNVLNTSNGGPPREKKVKRDKRLNQNGNNNPNFVQGTSSQPLQIVSGTEHVLKHKNQQSRKADANHHSHQLYQHPSHYNYHYSVHQSGSQHQNEKINHKRQNRNIEANLPTNKSPPKPTFWANLFSTSSKHGVTKMDENKLNQMSTQLSDNPKKYNGENNQTTSKYMSSNHHNFNNEKNRIEQTTNRISNNINKLNLNLAYKEDCDITHQQQSQPANGKNRHGPKKKKVSPSQIEPMIVLNGEPRQNNQESGLNKVCERDLLVLANKGVSKEENPNPTVSPDVEVFESATNCFVPSTTTMGLEPPPYELCVKNSKDFNNNIDVNVNKIIEPSAPILSTSILESENEMTSTQHAKHENGHKTNFIENSNSKTNSQSKNAQTIQTSLPTSHANQTTQNFAAFEPLGHPHFNSAGFIGDKHKLPKPGFGKNRETVYKNFEDRQQRKQKGVSPQKANANINNPHSTNSIFNGLFNINKAYKG